MSISERIREVRKESGLNQVDFAEKVGLTMSSVSQMERGVLNPSRQTMDFICEKFNVNRVWLETGEGEMKKPPLDEVAGVISEVLAVGNEDPVYKRTLSFLKIYQQLDDKSKAVIQHLLDELLKDS